VNGQDDDIDERYRRASADDTSGPSEAVRRAVLGHAAKLAAERRAIERPAVKRRRWRPAAYGGLAAAAALAGLLIVPHFLPSTAPLNPAPIGATAPPAASAPAARAPTASAPAMRESTPRRAQDSASVNALQRPAPAAEFTGGAAAKAAPQRPTPADSASAPRPSAALAGRASAGTGAPLDAAAALRQAAQSGDIPRLSALLEEEIDVDARDAAGRTALLLAVLRGQAAAVDVLLAHGADPNAADASGTTALAAAEVDHQAHIIAALRRAGAR